MKAITQDTYGSAAVLEARDIDTPEIGDDQVLIRVQAAGVNPADWAIMSGLPYIARPVYGLRRPKAGVRGTDVSGTVEAVGSGVTRFKPGDEVFGSADGSYAEYALASEEQLAPKPANLTLRRGGGSAHGRTGRAPGAARRRGRAEGADQRSLRRHRHLRGPDREVARCGGHRGGQHPEPRHGPIDRRGSRHRLHEGETSPEAISATT